MSQRTPEEQALDFIVSRKTVFLATINTEGVPWASSAPVLVHEKRFYVGGNYIAERTRNLIETGVVCAHFRDDESHAPNVFALERFTLRARAIVVERESPEWSIVIPQFEKKFGDHFDFMFALPDFFLFRLDPLERTTDGVTEREHGLYVRGFARAFDILPHFSGAQHVQGSHQERAGEPQTTRAAGTDPATSMEQKTPE